MTTKTFDIRRERILRGYSLRRLAQELGISDNTLRRLEEHEIVRPETAKVVADFFEVTVLDVAPELLDDT